MYAFKVMSVSEPFVLRYADLIVSLNVRQFVWESPCNK